MRLKALVTALVLSAAPAAVADPGFSVHGDLSVGPPMRRVPVRDRRLNTIDRRYDRYYDDDYDQHRLAPVRVRWNNLNGLYQGTFGDVRLMQYGDRITGDFEGGGTIDGRLVGNRIFFRWQRGPERGRGVWIINGRGSLSGMWGTDRSNRDGGRWDLQRVSRISRR